MKHSNFKTFLAVSSIYFIMPGALIVNPAIQTIAEEYPSIPYVTILLISTIPQLMTAPFSLIAGAIAGNRIRYRHLLYIALTLYIVGGAMPYVFRSFLMVLAGRTIYGIGAGLVMPLANALVIHLFEENRKAHMLSFGSIITNVASTIFMLISGFISAINVNYIWLLHFIALIPFAFIAMYLPEIEIEEHYKTAKTKLPISVYVISFSMILIYMNVNPMLLNMSTLLTTEEIGNATIAGTILSVYTVGGIVGGIIFRKMYTILKNMTIPVTVFIIGGGLALIILSHSIPMMILGSAIIGIGFASLLLAALMQANQNTPKSASAMISALILGGVNLAGFLSSLYVGFIGTVFGNTSPRLPLQISMIMIVVISIIWAGYEMRMKIQNA